MLAAGYPSVDEYNSNNQSVPTTDMRKRSGKNIEYGLKIKDNVMT